MTLISSLTKKELITINNDSKTVEEFFTNASDILMERGYVKESFLDAILEREKKYPTGLEMPKIVIAIPHTDVEHINEPFIFINRMSNKNLEFIQMGTDDVIVKPEYIIILGINQKENQVGLLSGLMEVFDDEDFINELRNAEDEEQIYKLFIEK